jgi:hypothetical protein
MTRIRIKDRYGDELIAIEEQDYNVLLEHFGGDIDAFVQSFSSDLISVDEETGKITSLKIDND